MTEIMLLSLEKMCMLLAEQLSNEKDAFASGNSYGYGKLESKLEGYKYGKGFFSHS